MHDLPPLNGMKAFEAAARTGSFARAALEFNVSSAAVSQQVRLLEAHFGKKLFLRQGNRLTLTDAGQSALPQTTRALGDLAAVSARLLERDFRGRLVISAPYSLAELWLVSKLAQFADLHPGCPIEVRAEEDPVEFGRHGIDVRISYGAHHYATMAAVPLFHDSVLAVCAPDFWYRNRLRVVPLADLGDDKFIHINWGPTYAVHPTWSRWFAASGSDRTPDPVRGQRMSLSTLAIAAARQGMGVALGQRSMARVDLETNRLIALSPMSLPVGQAYVAFMPPPKADRPLVKALMRILTAQHLPASPERAVEDAVSLGSS